MDVRAQIDMTQFTGLTQDSRKVEAGFLFAALPGTKVDGRDYIKAALEKGARGILVPAGTAVEDARAIVIEDGNPGKRFAKLAAAFYGAQPKEIVAVTGTNGKTSTVTFAQQIWSALGKKSASLGTLGVRVSGADIKIDKAGSMTTPDPVTLHRDLKTLAGHGVQHLAMEASSHGLDQFRLDGVKVRAAGFTSFSRDHMDYHKDEAEYLAAKTRLFSEVCETGGVAVLNADIPEFTALKKAAQAHGLMVWSYGEAGQQIKIIALSSVPDGQMLDLELFGKVYRVHLPLAGRFQAYNALCALGLVLCEDTAQQDKAVAALEKLTSVPGRLQSVTGHPKGAGIYVDYAHTPDAIETVLKALRPHVSGKLVCIFGCGGDRDPGKRPLMGKAAAEYADIAIVTDDNPRSEDPASIRAAAQGGAPDKITNIAGRAEAIHYALSLLEAGDVLALTGKGHEEGQEFANGRIEPFSDVEETQKQIRILKEKEKS